MSIITPEELKKIVEFANSVPEEYRQKCFELLLSDALNSKQPSPTVSATINPNAAVSASQKALKPFILPIDVKAFLSQYGLDESILWNFFIIENDDIRPIYTLQATKKATVEIQHALMLTLENALMKGQFQTDYEVLRNRCIENKCYDASNFTKNIQNNSKLFKSILNDQPLLLSPDGKSELAELLEQLKG
jgi:hypothetical protein